MPKALPTAQTTSHALSLGFDDNNTPVCIVVSADSLSEGGEQAMAATQYTLVGNDFHLAGPLGTVIIKDVSQMCRDAAKAQLPIIAIDPAGQREKQIKYATEIKPESDGGTQL